MTAVLGAEGIGAYQMVFPVYTVLLTVSSTGIPNAMAKLIAEGGDAVSLLKKSLILFGLIGAALSVAVYMAGNSLAAAQGNYFAAAAYRALSPSVFLVSVISCVRGYCQGKKNMIPTAFSQVTEQATKLAVGLVLCYVFGSTPYEKAALATLAVTVSEAVALAVVIFYAKRTPVENAKGESVNVKRLLSVVFPITLSAVMLPLSRAVDGFMVINLLRENVWTATARYGLYSGATESVISLPVAVCYAFAAAAIPEIAADKTSGNKKLSPIYYTLAISVTIALLTYFFPNIIVNILYFSLSSENREILYELLRISSAQIIGLSLLQTMTAVLIASDKLYLPCLSLGIGIVVKIILTFILVPNALGIYGCAVSDVVCYFIAMIADALFIIYAELDQTYERSKKLAPTG